MIEVTSLQILHILKGKCEQFYANKFNNLNKMDKFLKRYKLPKLTPEETDNGKSPISVKEIEFVLKYLSTQKTPGPDGFTGEFYQ